MFPLQVSKRRQTFEATDMFDAVLCSVNAGAVSGQDIGSVISIEPLSAVERIRGVGGVASITFYRDCCWGCSMRNLFIQFTYRGRFAWVNLCGEKLSTSKERKEHSSSLEEKTFLRVCFRKRKALNVSFCKGQHFNVKHIGWSSISLPIWFGFPWKLNFCLHSRFDDSSSKLLRQYLPERKSARTIAEARITLFIALMTLSRADLGRFWD